MKRQTSAAAGTLLVLAYSVLTLLPSAASAQSTSDAFNVPNVTVTGHSSTVGGTNDNNPATDPIYNVFGGSITNNGSAFAEPNDRVVIADGNPSPAFINFTIASLGAGVSVSGVTLYIAAGPGENSERGAAGFSLFADGDNNGSYESTLVTGVNPVDTFGVPNTYSFLPTAATKYRAEFTPNTGVSFPGPRLLELDAVTIPEPASLGVIAAAAVLCGRRRIRRA